MTNWYYARDDERMGPVSDTTIGELVASGTITSQTLVWKEGMAEWQPYSTVETVSDVDSSLPESIFGEHAAHACAECGRGFTTDEMVAYENLWVCTDCKEVFFQRLREGGGLLGQIRYGGFWIRFCARFLDGILLSVVNGLWGAGLGAVYRAISPMTGEMTGADLALIGLSYLSGLLLSLSYEVYFVGKHAATPGKMVFGLKVLMSDGGHVSYARAAGRYFAQWLSTLTLLIGYIMAAFDGEKRALHDHICDTRVVRR